MTNSRRQALETFAKKLNRPYIYGPTPDAERLAVINQFKTNPNYNCIFCSRIADNAIDLYDSNDIILGHISLAFSALYHRTRCNMRHK